MKSRETDSGKQPIGRCGLTHDRRQVFSYQPACGFALAFTLLVPPDHEDYRLCRVPTHMAARSALLARLEVVTQRNAVMRVAAVFQAR